MKQILRKLSIAALAFVGAMAVSCINQLEEPQQPQEGNTVTLTTSIELGAPESKALTAAGVKTFAAGETIAVVYKNTSDETVKAVSTALTGVGDIFNEGKKATITVTLDNPKAGGALRYIYPAAMAKATIATDATIDDAGTIDFTNLNAQDGTLATLASSYDLAIYDGNLTGEAMLPTSASLTNPLTIGAFTITDKDESSTDVTGAITQLTVNDGTTTFTVNRAAATGPIYVAMLPVTSDKTITLTAASSAHHYLKTVTGKALAANNLYSISVDMPQDMLYEPLTIVTTADNTGIYVRNTAKTSSNQNGVIKYTINGGAEQTIAFDDHEGAVTIIDISNANSVVRFFGDNATYLPSSTPSYKGSFIFVDQDCYVYGNIMSLIRSTGFYAETALTRDHTFDGLFYYENDYNLLKNHPSKSLLLPATTLTEACYRRMFKNCKGLASAPALPATTLVEYCYYEMFNGCTGLTTAPALPAMTLTNCCYFRMFCGCTNLATAPSLPAKTLEESCYMYMFSGCTGLTTAPALPAGTMKKECYYQMFEGCSNLSAPPALPATTLAEECYRGMFANCANLTSAPALPATTLADNCYNYMFYHCTSITTAPVLPAQTLVKGCYCNMFNGCTKLNSVTCLAQTITADYCTSNWLDNAGTDPSVTIRQFFTPSTTAWASPSVSGIPSGWTRVGPINLSSQSENCVAQNGAILTGTLANNVQISIADGATVTLDNLSINADGAWTTGNRAGITCAGNATITLVGTNTVKGFNADYPGILVPNGSTLTINGTGSLTSSSQGGGAGIGGKIDGTCGNITITGGTVNASSNEGTGIGSGYCYTGDAGCGNISISGGTVVATGGGNSAGIGTGSAPDHSNSCGTITISGTAHVTATGGASGAGIGTGNASVGSGGGSNHCGAIRIESGTVIATGGEGAAAIGTGAISASGGSGGLNDCVSVEITTGITSVTATKGSGAPNVLGAGKEYSGGNTQCNTVTITGLTKVESGDTWTLTP